MEQERVILQQIVDRCPYSRVYDKQTHNCLHMSREMQYWLEQNGLEADVRVTEDTVEEYGAGHAFVKVETENDAYWVEATNRTVHSQPQFNDNTVAYNIKKTIATGLNIYYVIIGVVSLFGLFGICLF